MRKFYQLLLLIISLLSLTLFLIYRHEYNRLHYVLEVFNFFGQPCNISELRISEDVIVQHDWGPTPFWYENDDLHTYSGFWTDKSEAKVIAAHDGNKKIPRNCYLWYENRRKPVIGKFRYSSIEGEKQDPLNVYFYYCSMGEYSHNPYAVSFSGATKRDDKLNKILLKNLSHKVVFNTTMCIVPSSNFNKNEFIEFVSFHSLIGVDSFIFYTDNIPYRLQKIMMNLSNRLAIKITFFPWNSKLKDDIAQQVIENDCMLRALKDSNNIVTLSMNEYVVPTKFYMLKDVIYYFSNQTGKISLPVQVFCIENRNHKKPIALQNTNVAYYNNNLVRQITRNVKEESVIKIGSSNYQVASIHKYVYCMEKSQRNYPDNSIMKYSTDFLRSTLVQLYLHDQL